MRKKLSEKVVAALPAPHPSGKQAVVRDGALLGFGVLVSGTSPVKSWIVEQRRIGRRAIARCDAMSLDQARHVATDWLARMRRGEDPKELAVAEAFAAAEVARAAEAEGMTLQAALDNYLANKTYKKGRLKESTKKYYRDLIERCLSDWLKRPIRSITVADIRTRHAALFANNGGCLANMAITTLRAVLEFNGVEGLVRAAMKDRYAEKVRRKTVVEADELAVFWKAVQRLPDPRHRTAITLMLFAGLRKTECLALRWSEINLEAGTLTLSPDRNKSRRVFVTPLSSVALDALKALRKLGQDRSGYCFPSATSKTGHVGDFDNVFTKLGEAIGHKVTRHDLRRTFATASKEAGVARVELKALLNHAADDDVTDGYVITGSASMRRATQRICDYLFARCTGKPLPLDEVETLKARVAALTARLAGRGRQARAKAA